MRSKSMNIHDEREHPWHGGMDRAGFERFAEEQHRREELAPQVGQEAPDFDLPVLNGGGRTVRLSSLRGSPVALIFGSYT